MSDTNLPSLPTPAPVRREGRVERYVDRLSNSLIESLGSKPDLESALIRAGAGGNEPAQRLLILMGDPRNAKKSLSRLAMLAGLSGIQLCDIMRDLHAAEAVMEFSRGQKKIARNIVEDAGTVDIACPRCEGWGKITDSSGNKVKKKKCPTCRGKCTVRRVGNPEARKLMGEVVGWTKTSGPAVVVNVGTGSALESVMSDMDRAGAKITDI